MAFTDKGITSTESSLVSQYGQGMQDLINQQKSLASKSNLIKGVNVDPQDVAGLVSAYNKQYGSTPAVTTPAVTTPVVANQYTTGMQDLMKQLQNLTGQEYKFDPNQFIPGAQKQANAIYSPQQAELEALKGIQQGAYEQSKIQTEKDFQKRLQQETEAINRRGAYFSGGAIQNEQDIRSEQGRALNTLALQNIAAQSGLTAQQAALEAEKTQFIQDRVINAENGAYARWTDQRNFSFQSLQTQFQNFANERDFARGVFESDRTFSEGIRQFNVNTEMENKRFQASLDQFKKQYALDEKQYKMAKKEFDLDMKIKKLSYDQALSNFKEKYAVNNSGIFGVNQTGNDVEQSYWDTWSMTNNLFPQNNSSTSTPSLSFGF